MMLKSITEGLKMHLRRFENLSKIKNTLELAQPRLAKSITDFDTDPMLFAAGNTWIDLKTGQPVTPKANTLVSLSARAKFDPNAEYPEFESFLNEIFLGDTELKSFVQRVVGYALTGRIDEQCFFPMNGDGANGKSTLLNILSKLMGDYSKTAAATTLMANQREGVGDDLIHLTGARMITVSETDKDQPLAEAKLKRMTGGDEITARALYGSYTTFKIMGKIFIATNSLPKVNGRDHGIFRRFQIVPFNRTFMPHEQDKALPDKLEAELSGIPKLGYTGLPRVAAAGAQPTADRQGSTRSLSAGYGYRWLSSLMLSWCLILLLRSNHRSCIKNTDHGVSGWATASRTISSLRHPC
jgi:putative DNA primase/helicase